MVLSFSRARHVTSVRRHPFCLVHRASIRTQTKRIYREAIDTVLVHMEKHVPSTKQVPCASGKKKVKKQQVLNAYYFGSATTSPVVTSIRAGSTGKSQALPCSKQASTWHLAVHGCCVYQNCIQTEFAIVIAYNLFICHIELIVMLQITQS